MRNVAVLSSTVVILIYYFSACSTSSTMTIFFSPGCNSAKVKCDF